MVKGSKLRLLRDIITNEFGEITGVFKGQTINIHIRTKIKATLLEFLKIHQLDENRVFWSMNKKRNHTSVIQYKFIRFEAIDFNPST